MNFHIYHAAVDLGDYPFKDLNILINPVEHAETEAKLERTKRLFEVTRTRNIILDSGGNSIFNAEARGKDIVYDSSRPIESKRQLNLSPAHVIKAARKLKPNVVVALDWPLKKTNTNEEQENEFRKKLSINLEWATETVKLRNKYCPEINLLIPIQAKTLEQLDEFMAGLSGLKFTGVSLPYRNIDPHLTVLFLTRLNQLGIQYVHILGTTNFAYMAIAAYFARQGRFKLISMDSRSWKMNAVKGRGFMSPHNLLTCKIDEQTKIPYSLKNDCNCKFCKYVTFKQITTKRSKHRSRFLSRHNAMVTEQVSKDLYQNAKSLAQLEHFLNHKKNPRDPKVKQVIDALSLADVLKDENINVLKTFLGQV